MDNFMKFKQYREQYEEFYYNSYSISEDKEAINIEFEFEIPKLTKFHPKHRILKKNFKFKNIDAYNVKNLVFHIGLIELISYWKSTCSPHVIIKCGYLDENQINWWKKLYFYGLGEMLYTNGIHTNINDFMNIECKGEEIITFKFKNLFVEKTFISFNQHANQLTII